jgi:integrase
MLGNSIRVIESEDTLVAICFFRAWKKSPRYVAGCFRAATQSGKDILETHSILRNSLGTILADELAKVSLEHITRLPWNTVAEFTNFCRFVGRACLTILLSLSGHRLGELMSTQSTHWEYRNEEMFVKEEIEKTLDSISIPRHFSRLCETAAKTLWSLSYVNVDMYSVPLFHRGHSSTLAKIICKGGNVQQWIYTYAALNDNTLREWLNDYYNYHIIPLCPEIKYVHPEINPHQFRHSWAEFALRRFDDNVEPKIREHFLHKSFGATRKYTDGKLKESVRYSLEHDYLYDIVNRIDQNPLRKEFMGPAYLRVKKELQKLKILHLNDADAYIDEIVQSVESFLAFEWGFCVLFKDSKNNAKCHDRFTGFPNPHGRGSVKLCTNCPNSMNNLTQRDALIRIAYSHTYIVENHPIKAIGELSADIIRQIERRLEEK